MIHVYYSDGTEEKFEDPIWAEIGIKETVLGCNFATTVERVEDDQGNSYLCNWSLGLCKED